MKKVRLRRGVLAALGIVVLLGIAGGVAYAQVVDSGPVIKACAGNVTGLLRQDQGRGCLPIEHAVQWNQVGPQGPPGVAHADERTFYRGGANVNNWLPIVSGTWPDVRPNMTHVLTMHLDKGSYVVTAEMIAENDQGQGVVVCLLGNSTLGYALAQSAVGWAPGFALQQTFSAQSTFALDAAADLELSCFNAPPNEPAGSPRIGLADVIATRVDTVSATSEP